MSKLRLSYLWIVWGVLVSVPSITLAVFPVLPEIQLYHSLGSRGSSYSTVAGGITIHLSTSPEGTHRSLQLLAVQIPYAVADINVKVGGWYPDTDGYGIEMGIHDQGIGSVAGKGATLSLRHLQFKHVHKGNDLGEMTATVLHMGWSAGQSGVAFLIGLDFASMNTPGGHFIEPQILLGFRTSF